MPSATTYVDGERFHSLPQRTLAERFSSPDELPNDGVIIVMVYPKVLLGLRKLKDNNGQYLWQPSYQAGEPDRLFESSSSVTFTATWSLWASREIWAKVASPKVSAPPSSIQAAKAFLDSHRNEKGVLSAEDDAAYTKMEQENGLWVWYSVFQCDTWQKSYP